MEIDRLFQKTQGEGCKDAEGSWGEGEDGEGGENGGREKRKSFDVLPLSRAGHRGGRRIGSWPPPLRGTRLVY